jgi:chemotaxis protein MotB
MAGQGKQLQPIIIKRIKKGGHAAHGGAWKIAYADFVTAMMAFFLLMWLLGSTTEGDKKGIADYFNAPLKVALMGGSGSGASNSILNGGGNDLTQSVGQDARGEADAKTRELGAMVAAAQQRELDNARLENLKQKIDNLINAKPELTEFKNQIRLEKVADGLHIQIVDEQNRPMFDTGSALVKPYMRNILREIGSVLIDVDNRLALAGHTDATPYGSGDRGYSNWELSSDRANASRRELITAGVPDAKLLRVLGMASSSPLLPNAPLDPINRRISIIVMTKEAEDRLSKTFEAELPQAPAAPNPGATAAPARGAQ